MEESVATKITYQRLRKVVEGYSWEKLKGGKAVLEGLGGGFRFCELGPTLFDAQGTIREEVSFLDLARHVFFCETGEPLPHDTKKKSPLIGSTNGVAVYLLYNGILEDKSPGGGNVLTLKVLADLPKHEGPKVIYGTKCIIGENRLKKEHITFRQTPYEVKTA